MMQSRRGLLRSLICAVGLVDALFGSSAGVRAQDFPSKAISFIVPFAAGGPLDVIARALQPALEARLKQPVVIENIGGAGATIGTLRALRAPADGYTILLQNLALAAAGKLYPQTGIDPAANFATVGFVGSNALVLTARKDLPASNLAELKTWMQANRAKISHPGVGTTGHLTTVLFAKAMGVEVDLVPYRGGGPALQDMVAGHVDMYIATPPATIELIRDGSIKAFGVTARAPIPQLPQVPSLVDALGPDLEVLFWTALFVPAATPAPVIEKLSDALEQSLSTPAIEQSWTLAGMQTYPVAQRGPKAGDAMFRAEVQRWGNLIRDNNIKAGD